MADDPHPTAAFDQVADDLYALDPEQFVAARDQRAKELRHEGDTKTAKAVKALRRPTVAAWTVNQLVRRHPDVVDEFLDATKRLGAAQREALTGKEADLRQLSERRQKLMDELLARAEGIMEGAGRSSSAHQDDIVRTLHAASDPELATELRRGRLAAALEPISTLSGLTAWFEESGAAQAASGRDRHRRLERASREAEDALSSAERDLKQAQSENDRLHRELRDSNRRIERLTDLCDQRRSKLDQAQQALVDEES